MLKFLLDLDSLEGTNAGRRVEQLRSMGDTAASSYKLKRDPRNFNQSNDRYTPELKAMVGEKMKKWIHFFGYNEHEGNEKTGFFKYDDGTATDMEQHYYGFRKTNEAALNKVVSEGGWKGPKYDINKGGDCFEMFDSSMVHKLQFPGRDFGCKKLYGKAWVDEADIKK
jgi:hypothetical protein